MALYTGDTLHELGFRGTHETFSYDRATRRQLPAPADAEGTRNAASLYQVAYDLYRRGAYRLD